MALRNVFTVVLAIALAGCASMQQRACSSGEPWSIQDSLYFGMAKPTGGGVTPEEWTEFLHSTVTPRFPQGLTVWPASGQWRGADGAAVREDSHVVILIHPDDESHEKAVLEVMEAYKERFEQEAVLRVKAHVCPSF